MFLDSDRCTFLSDSLSFHYNMLVPLYARRYLDNCNINYIYSRLPNDCSSLTFPYGDYVQLTLLFNKNIRYVSKTKRVKVL